MPDFLNSVKREAEVDMSALKINGMAVTGMILAFAFSFSLLKVFAGGGTPFVITVIVAAALFLVMIFLQTLFVKDSGRLSILLFLETVAMFLPFIFQFSGFLIAGAVITYLFLLWGSMSGKSEMQQAMKIKIWRLSKFVLPKAVTAISIFIAAAYISFFQDQNLVVSKETFMKIIPTVDVVTSFVYPGISFNDSFESVLSTISGEQKLTAEQVEESRLKLKELVKIDFEARDSLTNIIYDAYKNYAIMIPSGQKILILIVLGIALFFTVRTVGAPVYWLVALLTALIYEILLALGFAVVVLETRSKEIVLLK